MKRKTTIALAAGLFSSVFNLSGQNPIIQTCYTPDPAPYVHGDTLYLFTDHDEDDAQYFKMKDWLLFSTTDMVNWTFRGVPMSTATFKWAKQGDNAWAAQAIERDGKWYWYVAAEDTTKHLHGIGVAVADHPEGPYKDALGKPLIPGGFGYIDPSVFIDDDGQAYLFWGNNGLWYAKLGRDMISLESEIIRINTEDESAFGPMVLKHDWQLNKKIMKTGYEEGPWVYKRGDTYYIEYAAGGVPEHMAYSTAKNINGPWKYRGRVMDEAHGSFTIHGGSVEFKGRNFMFYHNGALPNGGGFRRSSCVEEFTFNTDGSIPYIPFTKEGVKKPVKNLNPYERVEAETMANSYGLKTDRQAGNKHWLTRIYNGSWQTIRSVDFGNGANSITVCIRGKSVGIIEFRVGDKVISTINVLPDKEWHNISAPVEKINGVHNLTILYRGGDEELLEFDWWKMNK